MIDINKKYQTKDGREVRIYATDGHHNQAVHGAVKDSHAWTLHAWYSDGVYARYDRNGPRDLIEVRPRHKRTVWVEVYDEGTPIVYLSKPSAEGYHVNRIACIKVELDFEEGQGL